MRCNSEKIKNTVKKLVVKYGDLLCFILYSNAGICRTVKTEPCAGTGWGKLDGNSAHWNYNGSSWICRVYETEESCAETI